MKKNCEITLLKNHAGGKNHFLPHGMREEMYQWSHLAILGRENSSTSGEAASGGILKFSMSHERHIPIPVQVTIFPHEWLSRRGEKKILHERRSREWRIFLLPQLLSHEWGKIVMRTGIGMCLEWRIENFPSQNCQMTSLAFLRWKWKLVNLINLAT